MADNSDKLAGLKEKTINELQKDVKEAYNLGIEYDDVLNVADEIYHGGGNS